MTSDQKLWIDSHIHLDMYDESDQQNILSSLSAIGVCGLLAVSMDLASCQRTQKLHRHNPHCVWPVYGFHPEQPLPAEAELARLFTWMEQHRDEMVAVGEVGLPYYSRLEQSRKDMLPDFSPYVELLEQFIIMAKAWNKPIVLHAVYEDAQIACDLLEKHSWSRAHFHWFKGDQLTIERMARNGYYVSFTPDLLYEPETQQLARLYPVEQIMVETDGPWPFEGPFAGLMTHPQMLQDIVEKLAALKGSAIQEMKPIVYRNTMMFYNLPVHI